MRKIVSIDAEYGIEGVMGKIGVKLGEDQCVVCEETGDSLVLLGCGNGARIWRSHDIRLFPKRLECGGGEWSWTLFLCC